MVLMTVQMKVMKRDVVRAHFDNYLYTVTLNNCLEDEISRRQLA